MGWDVVRSNSSFSSPPEDSTACGTVVRNRTVMMWSRGNGECTKKMMSGSQRTTPGRNVQPTVVARLGGSPASNRRTQGAPRGTAVDPAPGNAGMGALCPGRASLFGCAMRAAMPRITSVTCLPSQLVFGRAARITTRRNEMTHQLLIAIACVVTACSSADDPLSSTENALQGSDGEIQRCVHKTTYHQERTDFDTLPQGKCVPDPNEPVCELIVRYEPCPCGDHSPRFPYHCTCESGAWVCVAQPPDARACLRECPETW